MPKTFKNVEVGTHVNKPTIRSTSTGKSVLTFSYAVGGKKKADGSGYEASAWYDGELWIEAGDAVPKINQGDYVHFKGWEKVTEYKGKTYNKTSITEILEIVPRGAKQDNGLMINSSDLPF